MVAYRHQITDGVFTGTADFAAATVTGVIPAQVWYAHSATTGTFASGSLCTFTQLAAVNNGAGNVSLDGATDTIQLAADTGLYEVTVFGDTEAPDGGDATTVEVRVTGVAFAFFDVAETNNQVGSWCDVIDTTGAAQTVEVVRSSVTGSGRLNVKAKVVALS